MPAKGNTGILLTARRRWVMEGLRVGLLVTLVFVTWATVFDKWTPESFRRPIGYCWDGIFTLALIKSAADFHFIPFLPKVNPLLGAPFVANWNDFPLSDDHIFFISGMVSRAIGVIAALNLAFVFCAIGAAVAMYCLGRWLRLRWEACVVAGALFGLSPFLFYRSVYHFTLTNYFLLPLFVPLWLWVGGRRELDFKDRRFRLSLVIGALAGIQNVYYFNYFLQILGLCILAQLARRKWRKVLAGSAVFAAAIGGFLAANVDTLWDRFKLGPNPVAVQRGASEVEIYALKPLELFMPGHRHHLPAFAAVGEKHRGVTAGEFPSPYLGIVGGTALIWLFAHLIRAILLGRSSGWGRFGIYSAWLIGMSVAGGGMQIFQAVTGLVLFRSNNRVSIFLLMFALLFLAKQLTSLSGRWPRVLLPLVACLLLIVGIWDQTPSSLPDPNVPFCEPVHQRELAARADEQLVAELEKRVPAGTLVYQLPPMPFPEAGFFGHASDYDQFRPYLYSKSLHFSYGNMRGRPQSTWQSEVAALPRNQFLAELEARGFGALYVLRNAYSNQQIAALLSDLNAAGSNEVIRSGYGDSFVVLLRPKRSGQKSAPE